MTTPRPANPAPERNDPAMRTLQTTLVALLLAGFAASLSGCSQADASADPAAFQAKLDEAAKAAQRGKELIKSPTRRR